MKNLILILLVFAPLQKVFSQSDSTKPKSENQLLNSDTIPYATLYVYRIREYVGSLMGLDLQLKNNVIDGLVLGKVMNNRKMIIKLYQAGKNELFINTELTRSAFLNVKMGESYYLKVSLTTGLLAARPQLQIMDKEQGQMDFDSIEKFTKPLVQ